MELQICVADAYMQPRQAEARHAGTWAPGSFQSQRRGLLLGPKTGALITPKHWLSVFVPGAGWGDSPSKCCCCPMPRHPGELRQGQERSNTPPNSRSSLPHGSWKNPHTWLPVLSPSLTAVSLVIYEMQMMMAIMRIIIPALAASRLS